MLPATTLTTSTAWATFATLSSSCVGVQDQSEKLLRVLADELMELWLCLCQLVHELLEEGWILDDSFPKLRKVRVVGNGTEVHASHATWGWAALSTTSCRTTWSRTCGTRSV